ncbi:hypothetical protein CPB86DRAFT_726459 [Serendipita vermifera]|nr:hypothetical protein CPB86DRAFT_726459 [Serendipita vermifera]
MVNRLTMVISDHTSVLGVSPSHSLLERDLVALLPTFPNLFQLQVNSLSPKISRGSVRALSARNIPKIHSLIVNYLGEPPNRKHQIFFELLEAFSSVERVLLEGKGTYMWPSSHPEISIPAPRVSLRELRVNLHHSQPSITGSDLAWLTSHSPQTLNVLHLYDLVMDKTMPSFISTIAPQLISFHVSSSRHSDLVDLPIWVSQMTKLRELVIRNDIPSAECFRTQSDLPNLVEALPQSLEHFGFAIENEQALDLTQAQIVKWARKWDAELGVLTLVLTSKKALKPRPDRLAGVRRLRLFHALDPDVLFSFMSPLTPPRTFPRLFDTAAHGTINRVLEEKQSGEGWKTGALRLLHQIARKRHE